MAKFMVLALAPLILANAPELPAPFVNQLGYERGESKRFTLPGAEDGTRFVISSSDSDAVVYQGTIRAEVGRFDDFEPAGAGKTYRIKVAGHPESHPFEVGNAIMLRESSRLAYQFFVDARGGFRPKVSPMAVTGGGPSRDGGGSTLETVYEGLLYASNPALFDRWNDELRYSKSSLYSVYFPEREAASIIAPGVQRNPLSDAPDLVKLLIWHSEWALNNIDYDGPSSRSSENTNQGFRNIRMYGYDDNSLKEFDWENLADHLAAAHAFYRPFLSKWVKPEMHAQIRQAAIDRWEKYERDGEVRRWTRSYKWIDEGRLEFNEQGNAFGQGLMRNLFMYLGEKNHPGGEPERFAAYARQCAQDIIANWNFDDPVHTWAARNAEHITPQALAMLLMAAPEIAPAGSREKLAAWAGYIKRRTNNLWHYRTHSDTEWAHRRSKEVGTVAGLGGAIFAASVVLDDPELRAIGWSQVNFVFGANPAGAHLSNKSAIREAMGGYWKGVERGWPHSHVYGVGALGLTRGTLDGSPTNDAFPYNPEKAALGDQSATPEGGLAIYGTEGWALTNRAWMATVAFAGRMQTTVRWVDQHGKEARSVRRGTKVIAELTAPLNQDPGRAETAYASFSQGDAPPVQIELVETGPDTGKFAGTVTAGAKGRMTLEYGHLVFRQSARLSVR
jgi:hypothetical protein